MGNGNRMFVQTLSDNNDEKQVILLRFVIQLSKPEYVIKLSVLQVHTVATIEYDSAIRVLYRVTSPDTILSATN